VAAATPGASWLRSRNRSRKGIVLAGRLLWDNVSTDQSMENLACPVLLLAIIHNDENLGFSTVCDRSMASSTVDYLLSNPDT